jgi:thiamine biosynthesis lipoprotein
MTGFAKVYKRARPALGTWLEIKLKCLSPVDSDAPIAPRAPVSDLMSEAFELAQRLETTFSRFVQDGELGLLNSQKPGSLMVLSAEMAEVLGYAELIGFEAMPKCNHAQPRQCFHVETFLPSPHSKSVSWLRRECDGQFDLGGIAKGYIVDRLFEFLRAEVPQADLIVNAGGDLRCYGEHQIELRIPTESDELRLGLHVHNCALATSSLLAENAAVGVASARYVGAEDGNQTGASSVCILANTCMTADAMTKRVLFQPGQALSSGVERVLMFDRCGMQVTP